MSLLIKITITILFLLHHTAFTQDDSETTFFKIASGPPSSSDFILGALIAHAISRAPNARPCNKGGSCGVDNLEAVSFSSVGSIENIEALRDGSVDAAIVQSDVAYLAHKGSGPFIQKGAFEDLVAIANLWFKDLHILVSTDLDVDSVRDFSGLSLAIGEKNSETLLNSNLTLLMADLSPVDIDPHYINYIQASKGVLRGDLDGIFIMESWPTDIITALIEQKEMKFIDLDNEIANKLKEKIKWFRSGVIEAETYKGQDEDIKTVRQDSLLVTTKEKSSELIYAITNSLWNEQNLNIFRNGFQGREIMVFDHQSRYVSIPMHDGAAAWYGEHLKARLIEDNE